MNVSEINLYAEEMVKHYLACAAWSSSDGEHESLELFDFSENAKGLAYIDCLYFVRIAYPWIADVNASAAGHLLWLNRNGHGTGFWDSDCKYPQVLADLSETMGYCEPYLSDNQQIEF